MRYAIAFIFKNPKSINNFDFFRTSNGYSNESLESLNLSSEDAESDREMDIEEEDLEDSIDEVVIEKEVEILRGEENEP